MVTKAQAGYQFHPDTEYRCRECVMSKELKDGHGCAWFGPSEKISPDKGSCNYFAHAHPDYRPDIPWLGIFTKLQLGYLENGPGFSCKRCEELLFPRHACKKVDRNSPGDTPGEINPNACCDFWQRDKKRGAMSTPALISLMTKGPKA